MQEDKTTNKNEARELNNNLIAGAFLFGIPLAVWVTGYNYEDSLINRFIGIQMVFWTAASWAMSNAMQR